MDKAFFDTTLTYCWDIIPGNHGFDSNKVASYLDQLDEPDRSFAQELIEKTRYISYEEFKTALQDSFDLFRNHIGEDSFSLLLSKSQIGSEHWLTALLWPQLSKLNVINIVDDTSFICSGHLVIIDDAIYSGVNVLSQIDNLTYKLAKKYSLSQKEIGSRFTYHIVVPFVSTLGQREIERFCRNTNIQFRIYAQHDIFGLNEQIKLTQYYNDPRNDLYKQFEIESPSLPPFYFDHKVARSESTFSTIYLKGIIPSSSKSYGHLLKRKPSREKIQELERLFRSKLN